MPRLMKQNSHQVPQTAADRLRLGAILAKQQEEMPTRSFKRHLREQAWSLAGVSPESLERWIRGARALASAVSHDLAREALLEVTSGKGLISSEGEPALSDRYAAGLRKHPVPTKSTSYEDYLDWARGVDVVASHHVSSKAAPESWQIQTAKARFSEVFRRARTEGPQHITKQGKEAVVMVAEEQYNQLVGKSRQPKNIVDFFRQSPLVGLELDLERDRSPARDVKL